MPETSETATPSASAVPSPGLFLLGAVTNFFDTLGVGSFATTTAVLRLGRVMPDENIPGTLNVGHAIPTILEAVLFIIALGGMIDVPTIVTMVIAGGIGAWFGTSIVVHWPRRTIQRAMAIALVITAAFMALRMLTSLSLTEGTIGFTGIALAVAIVASLVIGSLTSLGIGNYAPTMAATYMLGMNQKAVFPIMAASASLILPAFTLGSAVAAVMARFTRSAYIEVAGEDYVRTARSKGVPERTVIWTHTLRNALIPVITLTGLQFGFLLGGAIVVETVFAWPGLGRLLIDSVSFRDYPVIQAEILLFAVEFVLINLIVDLLYGMVNPEIRLK